MGKGETGTDVEKNCGISEIIEQTVRTGKWCRDVSFTDPDIRIREPTRCPAGFFGVAGVFLLPGRKRDGSCSERKNCPHAAGFRSFCGGQSDVCNISVSIGSDVDHLTFCVSDRSIYRR